MILFSVSLPGRFGDWCDHVIARLAETALGSVVPTGANTAEELATVLFFQRSQLSTARAPAVPHPSSSAA